MAKKFRTIEIKGKCYDIPKDMPLPRIGERVGVGSKFGTVSMVVYQFVDTTKNFAISIKTISG